MRRYGSVGFNHYLHDDDPGDWLTSKAGMEFFGAADEMGLVVSIHARPHQLGHLKRLAATFPGTVFLLHHLGFPMRGAGIDPVAMSEIEACSELSNIHIKVSGFDIGLKRFWDYPYPTTQRAFMRLFRAFGATRCHWGSNYPMCRPSMTYRQALECVQESRFLTAREVELVLGESLIQILGEGIVPSRPSIRSTPAT